MSTELLQARTGQREATTAAAAAAAAREEMAERLRLSDAELKAINDRWGCHGDRVRLRTRPTNLAWVRTLLRAWRRD